MGGCILRKKHMTDTTSSLSPNPRILRALNKQEITVSNLAPVDTSNSNIPTPDSLPDLPNRKKRTGPITVGKRKLSYQLRYLFKALLHWKNERDGYKIAFATVHFNLPTEHKLKATKKGPVSAYADRLSKALPSLDNETNFFFVMEQGKKSTAKRLHAHILIAYHPDDLDTLKVLLKKGANTTGTGLRIQHTYILKHPAKPGSIEYSGLEIDEANGMCCYERDHKGSFYRELPVDAGAVDYISKELARKVLSKTKHPYFAPRSLTKIANELWDAAYEKQKSLKHPE